MPRWSIRPCAKPPPARPSHSEGVARGWPIQSDRRKPDLNPNTRGPTRKDPLARRSSRREACRCFCYVPTQLSAIGSRPSAEILGSRQWLERKNSQVFAVCCYLLPVLSKYQRPERDTA